MIETLEKEIDGVVYKATQLPAMRAVKLLNRLGRVLGPSLAKLGGAIPSGGKLADVDVSALDFAAIGDAVATLFGSLDDATLEALLRDLLSGVSFEADGKAGVLFPDSRTAAFDAHFTGRVGSIPRVALFAFEASFGGFSDALAAVAVKVAAAKGEGKAAPLASVKSIT